MSHRGTDSLSLESLFAFMDGLDSPVEKPSDTAREEQVCSEELSGDTPLSPQEVVEGRPAKESLIDENTEPVRGSDPDTAEEGSDISELSGVLEASSFVASRESSGSFADEEIKVPDAEDSSNVSPESALLSLVARLPVNLTFAEALPTEISQKTRTQNTRTVDTKRAFRGKHAALPVSLEEDGNAAVPKIKTILDCVTQTDEAPCQDHVITARPESEQVDIKAAEPVPEPEAYVGKEVFPADDARLSIDECLAKLIFERAEQLNVRSGSQDNVASVPRGTADALLDDKEGASASSVTTQKLGDAEVPAGPSKETPAIRIGNVPEDSQDQIGCPPAESAIMFDEPPKSIGEEMLQAEQAHRRGFAFKIAGGLAAGVLGIALISFAVTKLPFLASAPPGANAEQGERISRQLDDASKEESVSDASRKETVSAPDRDLSGTVVYRYTASSGDGEEQPTVETVTFGRDGLCENSTLEVELADERAAQAYLDQLQRDFGTSYQEGSTQGLKVIAKIAVSANKLDREGYEDALRISVEDLAIVKKS